MDETNFFLDQVGIKQTLLQFNISLLVYFSSFGGHTLLKRCGPACTWVVQGQPAYAHRKKTTCPRGYVTVLKISHIHP
jgi:hypothetical protein